MKLCELYGKEVIPVPLEMRVDSKHRNVGFLALSGRSKVGHPRSAHSHKRTFRSGLRYMEATAVSALPSIGVRSNLKSGIVRGGRSNEAKDVKTVIQGGNTREHVLGGFQGRGFLSAK